MATSLTNGISPMSNGDAMTSSLIMPPPPPDEPNTEESPVFPPPPVTCSLPEPAGPPPPPPSVAKGILLTNKNNILTHVTSWLHKAYTDWLLINIPTHKVLSTHIILNYTHTQENHLTNRYKIKGSTECSFNSIMKSKMCLSSYHTARTYKWGYS